MAVTEQQFERFIDMFEGAIRDGSLGGGGQDTSSAINDLFKKNKDQELKLQKAREKIAKDTEKSLKGFNSRLNQFSKDFDMHSQLISESFGEAIQGLNYENLELVPKALERELKKSPAFRGASFSSLEQTLQFFSDIAEKKELIDSDAFKKFEEDGLAFATDEIREFAQKSGLSLDELRGKREELTEQVKEASKAQQKLTHEMRGGHYRDVNENFNVLKSRSKELTAAFVLLASSIAGAARPAFKFGTDISDSLTAFTVGMNPQEFAQNVATYRQSIQAAGISTGDFKTIVAAGADELTEYTGELKDSIRLQSSAFEAAKRFGVEGGDAMKSFMNQQVATFKKFNMVFSMTADQFIAMNDQIKKSTAINEHMYRLDKTERAQKAKDIQQTVLQLRTQGLMQEQAMKVVEAMSAIAAKSPKERLKQAAKLQAVGGALGFGAEAGRAAQAIRTGKTQTPEFAKDMEAMQKRMGEFMGQGLPQEMMASQIIQATGLESLLGPKSDFADLNKEQYQATQNIEKLAKKRNDIANKALATLDKIQAFLAGPILKMFGSAIGFLGVMAGGAFLKSAAGGLLSSGGMIGNVMRIAAGMLGPLGIITAIVGTAVAAVAIAQPSSKKSPEEKRNDALMRGVNNKLAEDATAKILAQEAKLKGLGLGDLSMRKTESFFGGKKRVGAGGEEISEGKFFAMSNSKKRAAELAVALERVQAKQTEMYSKSIKDGTEIDKEQAKLLAEAVEELKAMKDKIDNPDKVVEDAINKNTEEGKKQHEEKMKSDKKAVKIQWARVGAST